MTGIVNSTGAKSGIIGTTVGTPAGGGKVLQVFSTTKTSVFSMVGMGTGAGDWEDITGLSVAITPSAEANKILISGVVYIGNTTAGDVMTRIVRDSTPIGIADAVNSRGRGTTAGSPRQVYELQSHPFNFLDSPSTTSATTYKMQIWSPYAAYVNRSSDYADNTQSELTVSTITVMEIG